MRRVKIKPDILPKTGIVLGEVTTRNGNVLIAVQSEPICSEVVRLFRPYEIEDVISDDDTDGLSYDKIMWLDEMSKECDRDLFVHLKTALLSHAEVVILECDHHRQPWIIRLLDCGDFDVDDCEIGYSKTKKQAVHLARQLGFTLSQQRKTENAQG